MGQFTTICVFLVITILIGAFNMLLGSLLSSFNWEDACFIAYMSTTMLLGIAITYILVDKGYLMW